MAVSTRRAVGGVLDRPRSHRRSRTGRLRRPGADGWDPSATGPEQHLQQRYGGEARVVQAMAQRDPSLAAPLVSGLPHLRAAAVYAVRYEMATPLADVLERRVRGLMLSRDATPERSEERRVGKGSGSKRIYRVSPP